MGDINIEHLAKLAGIRVTDAERAAIERDLASIINMIDAMQDIDTAGVAPLSHPLDASARLRPDAVTETDQRDELQAGAPEVADGLYLVPRVVE